MHRNPFSDIRHEIYIRNSIDIIGFIGFQWMSCVPKIFNTEVARNDIASDDPNLMAMLFRISERVFGADVTQPDDDSADISSSYNTHAPGMPYYHTRCPGNYTSLDQP